MKKEFLWLTIPVLILILAVLPLSQGLGGEAGKKAETPAETKALPEKPAAPEKPAGLVGTIIAVVPQSRTLVVDVPLAKEVLRIGAVVTDKTRIRSGGKAMSFEAVKPEARVRINFRRVDTGDEAILVEILDHSKG